eukprot:CAMPEP_0116035720 /NCGR_PEP_ID=MMETSP0321-20121206/20579_1 /TAXON_ID=163516 /ORGANISM="Leptocylindrus danicus var. danicus, Strain B650" /LENGTH=540 /DNA_ID=CAMNT_0003512693 /DNA_START=47 /DNA_END=1669 /DNA_ORIENTATION=-
MRCTIAAILLSLHLFGSTTWASDDVKTLGTRSTPADEDKYADDPFSDMSKTAYVPSAYVMDFENTIFDHEDVDEYNVDEHGEIDGDSYHEGVDGRALRGYHRKFKYWCKARLHNKDGVGDVYGYRQLEVTEQDLEPEDDNDKTIDDAAQEQVNIEGEQSRGLYSNPRRKCRDHSKFRATCCFYNRKRRGYKRYGYRKCYREHGKGYKKCHRIKFLKRHGFYRGGRFRERRYDDDIVGSSYDDVSRSYGSRDDSHDGYYGSSLSSSYDSHDGSSYDSKDGFSKFSGSYDSGDLDVSFDSSHSASSYLSDDYRRSSLSYDSVDSYGSHSDDYRHGSDDRYDSKYRSRDGGYFSGSFDNYRSGGKYDSSYDDFLGSYRSDSYGSDSYGSSSYRSGSYRSDSYDGDSYRSGGNYNSRSYKSGSYDDSRGSYSSDSYDGDSYRSGDSYASSSYRSDSYDGDSYDSSYDSNGSSYSSDSYDGSSSYDSRSYKSRDYDNSVSVDISIDGSIRKRKKCRKRHGCMKFKYDTDVGRGNNKYNMNEYYKN